MKDTVILKDLPALAKRMEAYHHMTSVFRILRIIKLLIAEEISKRTPIIISSYPEDVEDS